VGASTSVLHELHDHVAEHPVVPGDRIELGDVVVELVED